MSITEPILKVMTMTCLTTSPTFNIHFCTNPGLKIVPYLWNSPLSGLNIFCLTQTPVSETINKIPTSKIPLIFLRLSQSLILLFNAGGFMFHIKSFVMNFHNFFTECFQHYACINPFNTVMPT